MPTSKECPLCGEMMRLRETEQQVQIPGSARAITKKLREWTCPECDYFEEADEDEDAN